nr:hypothetical protein [Streptomyces sp. DASNCL29]
MTSLTSTPLPVSTPPWTLRDWARDWADDLTQRLHEETADG